MHLGRVSLSCWAVAVMRHHLAARASPALQAQVIPNERANKDAALREARPNKGGAFTALQFFGDTTKAWCVRLAAIQEVATGCWCSLPQMLLWLAGRAGCVHPAGASRMQQVQQHCFLACCALCHWPHGTVEMAVHQVMVIDKACCLFAYLPCCLPVRPPACLPDLPACSPSPPAYL